MKLPTVFAIFIGTTAVLFAHTMGKVRKTCPVDGTEFEALLDYSGTAFDSRLDLKKEGPIAQPWKLPDCPTCYNVYFPDDLDDATLERVRKFVLSDRYKQAMAEPSYYRLALIQEALGQQALDVGFSYLRASWQVEADRVAYRRMVDRALATFERAASELRDRSGQRDDYLIACYL